MHALVRTVFSRLHALDPMDEEEKLRISEEDAQEGEIRMTVSTNSINSVDGPQDPNPNTDTRSSQNLIPATSSEAHDAIPASPGSRPECA